MIAFAVAAGLLLLGFVGIAIRVARACRAKACTEPNGGDRG